MSVLAIASAYWKGGETDERIYANMQHGNKAWNIGILQLQSHHAFHVRSSEKW